MALARYEGVAQDAAGNVIANATVEVRRDQPGRPVVPLFSDRNGMVPLGNPITSNERGQFGFHVPGGTYYIRVFTGPSQAPFQEYTRRYQAVGTAAERDVEELASSLNAGLGIFATFAGLELFTPEADNVGARVINDADPALNGDYIYVTDTWVKQRGLPDTLARMEVTGGTADAIEASITAGVDGAAVVMLLLTPEATNTGPVTINGTDLVAFDGSPLEAGWLAADVPVFVFVNGDGDYQLTSDVRYQVLADEIAETRAETVAARDKAEQWADEDEDVPVETGQFSAKHHAIKAAASDSSASDSATTATTQAGTATGAAGDAVAAKEAAEALYGDLTAVEQAKDDAVAASEAAGVDHWADTKADATAGLGGYAEGDVIGVFADESKDGAQVFYRVESGALVEKIDASFRTRAAIASLQSVVSPELNDIPPDTVSDSSAAINSFNISKKRLSYGAGTWQADIEPWDGMVFEGVGKGRTILEARTTDFAMPFENVERVVLRDLTLRGFGALQFLTGTCRNVTLQNVGIDFGIYGLSTTLATNTITSSPLAIVENLRVLDCEFSDLTAAATRLDCTMQNAWFDRNHVHDIVGGGRMVGGFRVGLDGALTDEQFLAQRDVIFTSNVIEDCNNTTKTGDSTPGNNFELFGIQGMGRKIIATNNIIRRVQGVIYDNEALYTKAMMAVATGNLIEDSGSDEAAINLKGFSEADADQPEGMLIQCNNNIVRFSEYTVDGQSLARSGIQIAAEVVEANGNIVDGSNANGIVIQGPTENAGNYKDINANDNIIRNHLGPLGIRLRGGYERVSVNRNKVSWGDLVASAGVHAGVYVESVAGNRGVSYDMFEIWDNQIDMTDLTLSGTATASGIEALIEYPYNSVKIGGGFINVATGSSADRAVFIKDDRANDIIEKMYLGDIDLLGSQIITIESGVLVEHFTMHQRLEATTTDNTTKNVFDMTMPEGVVLAVKARVLAAAIAGTDAALYESHALFTRYGASAPVQVGTTTASVALQDVAGAWAMALNLSSNTARIQVNGDASQTVHWSAMVDIETLI